ncbi:hypothetical protein J2S19_000322 [Metabacillus malikii]|uniref:Uncharacterized protein n=2 Tax=Metabacillus malikii TaxID=1504265 RepID=A0ABT9ZB53_9BACI|nr:hypothetical protein [Metabacillus malikii]
MGNLGFDKVFPFYTLIPVGVLLSILYMFIIPINIRWILLPSGILISFGLMMQIAIFLDKLQFVWVGIPIAILCGYLMLRWAGENHPITNRIFFILIGASSLIVVFVLFSFIINQISIVLIALAFLIIGVYIVFFRK